MPRAEWGMLPVMPTRSCAFAARSHCALRMLQRSTRGVSLATIHARCTKESRRARDYQSSLSQRIQARARRTGMQCSRALGTALGSAAGSLRVRVIERHTGRLGERCQSVSSPWQVAICAPSALPPSTSGGMAAACATSAVGHRPSALCRGTHCAASTRSFEAKRRFCKLSRSNQCTAGGHHASCTEAATVALPARVSRSRPRSQLHTAGMEGTGSLRH